MECYGYERDVMMVNTTTSILALTWDTLPWQAGPNCGRASPSDEDYIEHRNTEDEDVHDEDDEQEQLLC